MSQPIENYAVDGLVDWLCWPRFDFGCLLRGSPRQQRQRMLGIAPEGSVRSVSHRYVLDTLVLETSSHTDDGVVDVTDFMPARDGAPSFVWIVAALEGHVPMCFPQALTHLALVNTALGLSGPVLDRGAA